MAELLVWSAMCEIQKSQEHCILLGGSAHSMRLFIDAVLWFENPQREGNKFNFKCIRRLRQAWYSYIPTEEDTAVSLVRYRVRLSDIISCVNCHNLDSREVHNSERIWMAFLATKRDTYVLPAANCLGYMNNVRCVCVGWCRDALSVAWYIALRLIVLYCVTLHCNVLYCIKLYSITMCCNVLHCIVLCYFALWRSAIKRSAIMFLTLSSSVL